MDFMHDQLGSGESFRTLNVLIDFRGKPDAIRSDNGAEFISKDIESWSRENDIEWLYIQPGHPTQNPYVERFNGTVRQELYNLHIFKSLKQVRVMNQEWMEDYNNCRPHKGIGYLTPVQMARLPNKSLISNCPN